MIDKTIKLAIYYDNGSLKNVTIEDYEKMLEDQDKSSIADFVYGRLYSRYIKPFSFDNDNFTKEYKNGFAMMANYCLLIETLESFKNGWGDSDRKSGDAFKQFFSTDPNFTELANKGTQIYKNIRCGILHQGETTGGWKITRTANQFYNESTIRDDLM